MLPETLLTTDPLLPTDLLERLARWIRQRFDAAVEDVSFAQHSNDVAEIGLTNGKRLMVKRGRFDWVGRRFETSQRASRLLRSAQIVAPEPLPLPDDIDDLPVEAYWRIELPTLAQAWPELGTTARPEAVHSWGVLIRRLHGIDAAGWGHLHSDERSADLETHLGRDIYQRLIPAVWSEWRGGVEWIERLGTELPRLVRRVDGRAPVLTHCDAHAGNVLLRQKDRVCVGLLDLEKSEAALPESDIAAIEVLHGPLFNQELPPGWLDVFLQGYGEELDPFVMAFFRAYHLANLGMFSGIVGDVAHAEAVLGALETEVKGLRDLR